MKSGNRRPGPDFRIHADFLVFWSFWPPGSCIIKFTGGLDASALLARFPALLPIDLVLVGTRSVVWFGRAETDMNRRDFLHPRRLARTASQAYQVLEEIQSPEPQAAGEAVPLLHVSRRAMATSFEIILPWGLPQAMEAATAGLDEIDRLEDQLTVYRDHSEVSRLNRQAAQQEVEVEAHLFDLLDLAGRITRATEGAFDITAGPLIKAWGFFRRRGRVPSAQERAEVLTRVGMNQVVLDPEKRTVRYARPGVEINLGSIGKGYALDRVAESLRTDWQLSSALLHGGHSSVYALGSEPGEPRGWRVGIKHPWDPERRLAVVRLRDQGLATSAATFQHLEFAGRKLGHILDPRSGWPAEGLASATVVAPSAAEADALATAFFILGVDRARAYCAEHPGIGAVLLPAGEHALPVVLGLGAGDIYFTSSVR
jgi:thiamine biosynthesis lipoprotein